ncbi:hypothetical protein B0A58_00890 [Flavobacterium branchiophilum NBRC 15030 = ATCC 35035]|uniref:Lipoprotein n=1 Tax=Flavobacterium branchiophilum TaxID=55197 RepID=A0A2H3KWP8_9FLAO|nr:hypothetical protein [Flavobacterium branchiophilum]OXA81914.1 hypothetical protein B0A58_00890 [Flavobacterium branchiophilum NBRC 15030 = ATCC 35035]PDS23646.1 hypothetical protein B0A77_10355 [Flavobacterium branchiophilum]TQM42307.1 hypothetical protein BC670_3356 [Flavobacterium branchiophilum]GEM54734.1 hypothetical protein FB1_09550 [Flavobacterium branchiophilum NBRC 15030 = ATCC 35035]
MKQVVLFIALFINFTISCLGQDYKNPTVYLNRIGEIQQVVAMHTWQLNKTLATLNHDRIEKERLSFVRSLEGIKIKIKNLDRGFEGDVTFRDKLLIYLNNIQLYIKNDYGELINTYPASTLSLKNMETYIEAENIFKKKMSAEVAKLNEEQKIFAQNHGLKIIKNNSEVGKKLAESNEFFDYSKSLYLIFFKCNITESQMTSDFDSKNYEEYRKNADIFKKYVEDAKVKLNNIGDYKNDSTLKKTVLNIVTMYDNEIKMLLPTINEYITNYKNFTDYDNIFKTKIKNKTQTDILMYNDLLKKLNTSITNYNSLNSRINVQRKVIKQSWEENQKSFIDKYTPLD